MSEQPSRVLPPDFVAFCNRRARKMICASAWNDKTGREEIIGFRFSPVIADWPICKQAEAEGWGKELRAAMIASMSRAMRKGENPEIRDVVPQADWIKTTRANATRYARAAQWQEKNLDSTFDARKFVGRLMASGDDLSQRSKAMTGDAA
jgi:hypothetical protein